MPDVAYPPLPEPLAGLTLSATLRKLDPTLSWSAAKKLITTRRLLVNDTLCTNDARRLAVGDRVTVLAEPFVGPRVPAIRILHLDPDVIVIEKPPHVVTQRPDQERDLSDEKKALQPTLDELVARLLPGRAPLYTVHRLDRDTSGLMLFALSVRAREAFIDLFTRHAINRTYHAVCLGIVDAATTYDTHIVRDRGDGLRGSTRLHPAPLDAKHAVTHVRPLELIQNSYTLLECRLETGRTHQIRIHLAEAGHMLCGEKLYTRPAPAVAPVVDPSGAPRQALHSTTLSFTHPITRRELSFSAPLPRDLSAWLARLRAASSAPPTPPSTT